MEIKNSICVSNTGFLVFIHIPWWEETEWGGVWDLFIWSWQLFSTSRINQNKRIKKKRVSHGKEGVNRSLHEKIHGNQLPIVIIFPIAIVFVVTLLSKGIGLAQQSRGARPAAPWAPLRFTSSPCGWAPWQVWFQPKPMCWTWTRWSDKWRGRSPSSSIHPMAVTADLVAKANPEMPQTGNSSQSCSASSQGPSPSLSCSFSIHLFIWCHVLLKPSLKELEPYLASMWSEHNCAVVWTFFGIAFLWDQNETWLFQSCGHCCFPNFPGLLSGALLQHHLLGFERAQLEFHHFQ